MSAAETIKFAAPKAASQPWSPTDRDRLIFQWVKFDGLKQSWVAGQLGLHQTTVSRILDRYERWIAHGGPSQQGGLSRDERIRAQRWLTYERNEWILNSALRIADEMESPTDTTSSTITRSPQDYSKETHVRTQTTLLHRSGLAARYLRLAHRINMDQKKLVEEDPLPDLEPLSHQDLAPDDDHLPALADTPHSSPHAPREDIAACHGHPARADHADDCSSTDDRSNLPFELAEADEGKAASSEPPTEPSTPMHQTHTNAESESPLTNSPTTTYDQNQRTKKTQTPAYPVAPSPPESMDPASSIAFAPLTKLALSD